MLSKLMHKSAQLLWEMQDTDELKVKSFPNLGFLHMTFFNLKEKKAAFKRQY